MKIILALLLCTIPLHAQTSGSADTSGPCSPAVTGNDNQFLVTCNGIGEAQGKELLKILNRISRERLDPKLVMEKLDEIQKGVSDIKTGMAKKDEEAAEAERIKRTAPTFRVWLTGVRERDVMLHIQSLNFIPFEYGYVVVSENNLILSGVQIGPLVKLFPSPTKPLFYTDMPLKMGKITNDYIELRFTYNSFSYEELHLPKHAGTMTCKYKVNPDFSLTALDECSLSITP